MHIPAGSIGSVVTLIKYVVSLGGNWNQFDVHEGEARRHKGQLAIEIDSPEAAVLVSTLGWTLQNWCAGVGESDSTGLR